jgi:hypothetical protein
MRPLLRLFVSVAVAMGFMSPSAEAQRRPVQDRTFMVTVLAHRVSWQVSDGWPEASVIPLLRDNPPRAGYAADNPAIIAAINAMMSTNGIWPMVSWWGPGEGNYGGDHFMERFLGQPGPPLAVLYEATGRLRNDFQLKGVPEDKGGSDIDFDQPVNADTFVADMVYLHERYFSGPHKDRFLRIDGKPVVFIWISHAFKGPFDKAMERVRARVPLYLIGSDFTVPLYTRRGIETVVPAMDAISTYGGYWWDHYGLEMTEQYPKEYKQAVRAWSVWMDTHAPHMDIMPPMIFNYDERLIKGRRGYHFSSTPAMARQLALAVREAIADPCATRVLPLAFIVSYDECYEGTCIIPSEQHGSAYQDVVRDVFKDPVVITREQLRECGPERDRPGR